MKATKRLTPNALAVLRARYLLTDAAGDPKEEPEELFYRVARHVAAAEEQYGGDVRAQEERFLELMASLRFLPNSPTLMNAGTPRPQLAACFVLPVEDSLTSIFSALQHSALIQQTGGGVGYDFSRIRPRGDVVASSGGVASGPVSFMEVFDTSVEAIRQGGRRRGANMGILSVRHPDIGEFAGAKRGSEKRLGNFNLSAGTPDEFMDALAQGKSWPLVNPRTGQESGRLEAVQLWQYLAECAWETGDPGLIFLSAVGRGNPTPKQGEITATNPCGEVPLLPYEACMLGSVNLASFSAGGTIDWEGLSETTALATRFLDDCLDVSWFPVEKIAQTVKRNRKIGLGVMGFADMLADMGLSYDSAGAVELADQVMECIQKTAVEASRRLAHERGPFPSFGDSRLAARGDPPIRNATLTAVAPTGTISLIAGCSSGIEPNYALAYRRRALDGAGWIEVNSRLERVARSGGWWTEETRHRVLHSGSLAGIPGVPERASRIFKTASEITPEWHVRIQAAFQKHVDNAVSKTINLPADAKVEDVEQAFGRAFDSGCKGITVYREGSKAGQVLEAGAGGVTCPDCGAKLSFLESTIHCRSCGYCQTP